MKRKSFRQAECPVARTLDAIGDWWSLLIIRDAFDGITRFNEFQDNLGIARGMLATRLRDLVEAGVLERQPASDGSAYQEYGLTEKGRDLFLVIVTLRQWGEAHLFGKEEPRSLLVDIKAEKPVSQLGLHAFDGRAIAWSDTKVVGAAAAAARETAGE